MQAGTSSSLSLPNLPSGIKRFILHWKLLMWREQLQMWVSYSVSEYNTAGNTPQNNQSLHCNTMWMCTADRRTHTAHARTCISHLDGCLAETECRQTCSSLAAQTHKFSRQTDGVTHTYLYMHALSSPTKTYRCGKKATHTQFEVDEMMRANEDE